MENTKEEELIAEAPVIEEENENEDFTKNTKTQLLEDFISSLSTHTCGKCKKTFVFGETQLISSVDKLGNKKRVPFFVATKRSSRKGIEHDSHTMRWGDSTLKNYFKRWEPWVDDLQKLINAGKHVTEISLLLGRTTASVNTIIDKLGFRDMYVENQRRLK